MIQKLHGHSGCRLELIDNNGTIFVRKISRSVSYNERLIAQCVKQGIDDTEGFLTPKIFSKGYLKKLFYFDMEYINGLSFTDYLTNIPITSIERYADLFLKIIPSNPIYDGDARGIFINKVNELDSQIIVKSDSVKIAIQQLKHFDWKCIYQGKCHGDLTFENILIHNDRAYLIDFLDSFYDSWMIDISKLFQDLELQWSYRNYFSIDENLNIRLIILKKMLIEKLLQLDQGKNIVLTIYMMLILNLIRIIPYVDSQKDHLFIESALNKINILINKQL
jgi:hypothetical protein